MKATMQSTLFEGLLQGLSVGIITFNRPRQGLIDLDHQKGIRHATHPKAQKEIAYWAEKEEEARRRIVSVSKGQARAR